MRILGHASLLLASIVGVGFGCQPAVRQFGTGGAGGTGGGPVDPTGPEPTGPIGQVSSTGSMTCPSGQLSCGGQCVDVVSNSDHCGACNHSCLGGACELSTCQPVVLASGQGGPRGVAVDDKSVYWANQYDGTVVWAPKDGGAVFKLAGGQSSPYDVATDGVKVYWVTLEGGTVMSVPINGSPLTTLASGQIKPAGIEVYAGVVFWMNSNAVFFLQEGSTPQKFADAQNGVSALKVHDTGVYWTADGGGTLKRVPIAGTALLTLASGLPPLAGIAVFGMTAYGTLGSVGEVRSFPIDGGGDIVNIVAKGQVGPNGIAADASGVYWTNSEGGTVMRAPLAGGAAETLAFAQARPADIATDDQAIYWSNFEGGTVMKLAK
jgi:sugar lactone lactonase YvrE